MSRRAVVVLTVLFGLVLPCAGAATAQVPAVDFSAPFRLAAAGVQDAQAQLAVQVAARRRAEAARLRGSRTVRGALRRALLLGAIDRAHHDRWRRSWLDAQALARRLPGRRRTELLGALRNVAGLAAERRLTPSRLRPAFLVVERNARFWAARPIPAQGQRVTFGRDPVVFEERAGQGLVLHPLASWGRVNGVARACLATPARCPAVRLRRDVDRLVGLVSRRGGFVAWEYLHRYGAGRGPWVSGMAEATAVQALARAAAANTQRCRALLRPTDAAVPGNAAPGSGSTVTQDAAVPDTAAPDRRGSVTQNAAATESGGMVAQDAAVPGTAAAERCEAPARRWRAVARQALGVFEQAPPLGVAVPGADGGTHYAMYSFDPGLRILNGFLQSITGLRDAGVLLGSEEAFALYRAGERSARAELRDADTGAWSLYSERGRETNLNYHQLTTGFLHDLCGKTGRSAYCAAEARFTRYESEPPRLAAAARPAKVRPGRTVTIAFRLNKVSTVDARAGGSALLRLATLGRGRYVVRWTPRRPGTYSVRVVARGLSGPVGTARVTVRVRKPKSRRTKRSRPERDARRRAAAKR